MFGLRLSFLKMKKRVCERERGIQILSQEKKILRSKYKLKISSPPIDPLTASLLSLSLPHLSAARAVLVIQKRSSEYNKETWNSLENLLDLFIYFVITCSYQRKTLQLEI